MKGPNVLDAGEGAGAGRRDDGQARGDQVARLLVPPDDFLEDQGQVAEGRVRAVESEDVIGGVVRRQGKAQAERAVVVSGRPLPAEDFAMDRRAADAGPQAAVDVAGVVVKVVER